MLRYRGSGLTIEYIIISGQLSRPTRMPALMVTDCRGEDSGIYSVTLSTAVQLCVMVKATGMLTLRSSSALRSGLIVTRRTGKGHGGHGCSVTGLSGHCTHNTRRELRRQDDGERTLTVATNNTGRLQ